MTRIIAGAARGRRLAVPERGTRPTSDRVREAMFSSIEAQLRDVDRHWAEVRVLDGYAGSGALGLEALSRGAVAVILVERNRRAASVLGRNIEAVGLPGAQALVGAMEQVADTAPPGAAVDLVLLDPPYDVPAATVRGILASLADHGWLADDCVIVVERSTADTDSPLPDSVQGMAQRRYGDTSLWYGRWRSAPGGEVSSA